MERYFYSTEIVTFLFCIIIFLFVLYNKPKKTRTCALCLRGLFLLWLEMLIEGIIYLYTRYAPAPTDFVVECLIFCHLFAHVGMMTHLLLYVDSLSINHYISKKQIIIPLVISVFVYSAIGIFISYPTKFFYLANNNIYMGRYILFLDLASIFGTVLTMLYIIGHAKEFPRGVTRMMVYSIPIMLFVEILQAVKHDRLYHGIIYLIPLMILYFFYHNNPYDQLTGYQDASSFESMLQYFMNKHKPFHFIYIELPKLKNSDYLQNVVYADSVGQDLLVRTCRRLEYKIHRAMLYKINSYSFAIILVSKNKAADAKALQKIKDELFFASKEIGPSIYFYAAHFAFVDSFENCGSHLGQLYVYYTINSHIAGAKDTWIEATDEDFKNFLYQHHIEQELLEMSRIKNLDDERIICYAQPIYDIASSSYKTAEVLVRMKLDEKLIFPDMFIPLAEKHECIHQLTLIILNKVCKYIKSIEDDFSFDAFTINCSSKELSDSDFCSDIKAIIGKNKVSPSKIRIELTESAMFENYNQVYSNMQNLREYGINFYLDDFGTGYSNFERLMSCPLHTIKFDKALLYKAVEQNTVDKVVSTMISLFKENNFHVLVEGVEDCTQNDYAKSRGFEAIQGYFFSRPVPLDNITDFFVQK